MQPTPFNNAVITLAVGGVFMLSADLEVIQVEDRLAPDASLSAGASGAVAPAMGYSSEPPYARVDPSGEPPKFHIKLRPEAH